MKIYFQKLQPRVINYWSHKHFKNNKFRGNCYQNCVTKIFKVVATNNLSLMYVSKHLTSMHLVNRNTRGEIIFLLWIRLFRRKFKGATLPQNISDNKTFWKTVEAFLSEKIESTRKSLWQAAKTLFQTTMRQFVVWILSFPICDKLQNTRICCGPISNNISDPIIKPTVKYRNHSWIILKREVWNRTKMSSFSFSDRDKKEKP